MATKISVNEICDLSTRILLHSGMSIDDAQIVVDHLLDGELSGHPSHGFYRIPAIANGMKKAGPAKEIVLENDSQTSALLNGNSRQGLVVALRATEMAIKKAKLGTIAVIGAYNYLGTTGGMGYFTTKIAQADMVGIMLANSGSATPPWGGIQPIFGTNPISISIPSENRPIVIDLATSKWAYGDIDLALKAGRTLPLGVVQDKEGNPSTDPNDALNGAMLPFGEHKGYALALAIELLAGPLVRAKAGSLAVPGSDGLLIVAINPIMFVQVEEFKKQVSCLIKEIKDSPKKSGVDEIYYPGEKSQLARERNKRIGSIEMVDRVLTDLRTLAEGKSDKSTEKDYI